METVNRIYGLLSFRFQKHILGFQLENDNIKLYFEKGHYGPEGPRMIQCTIKFIDHPAAWVCIWKWTYQIGVKWKGNQ